jgi:Na+/H+-translocating membrane pyrophosphatase
MQGTVEPDYKRCVKISTDSSIRQMIPPGALVLLTPIITGVLFGTHTLVKSSHTSGLPYLENGTVRTPIVGVRP